jgi:flagellin
LNQGVRNANDGISLAQTAEGALGEVTNNLQRIRELAVQAANTTNTATDRAALQNEVTALVAEIDRVATQTTFNGTKLLNGGFRGAVFQIGANAGDSITIDSIANSTASNLGVELYGAQAAGGAYSAASYLTAASYAAQAAGTLAIQASGGSLVQLGAIASASSAAERAGQVVAAINDKSGTTGVFAYITSGGTIQLQNATSGSFALSGATEATNGISAFGSVTVTSTTGVASLSVETYSASQIAIGLVDSALNKINTTRATLGAVQSRFESAVASQQTTSENLAASRSRIQDADFASETANLAKAQILQQSGIAMLAQANAIPQNVLALLQ